MFDIALQPRSKVLTKLCDSWLNRAAIRNQEYTEHPAPGFEADKLDYPPGLIPFRRHPAYVALDESVKLMVGTLAWLAWNMRVVDTEEAVVGRALVALLGGQTDLSLSGQTRVAIRHTIIDEFFHSHMHEVAVDITCRGRNVPEELPRRLNRPGASSRSYQATAAIMSEQWEREVARLAWTVVGELSIYEFLTLVSDDESIQPSSRELLRLHEKDEAAHSSVIAQVMREHFHEFSPKQRECFVRCLPLAIEGFSQQDWVIWLDVLELAGVKRATEIIGDMRNDQDVPDQLPLLRSYQRIQSLCDHLGVELRQLDQKS